MTVTRDICAVCAWRADCQKKFSISGRDIRCPDFVKNVSIGQRKEETSKEIKAKKEADNT